MRLKNARNRNPTFCPVLSSPVVIGANYAGGPEAKFMARTDLDWFLFLNSLLRIIYARTFKLPKYQICGGICKGRSSGVSVEFLLAPCPLTNCVRILRYIGGHSGCVLDLFFVFHTNAF